MLALSLLAACAPPGSRQAEAVDLEAHWKAGQSASYRMHQTIDGTVAAGAQTQPLKVDSTATDTVKVLSVDKDGTATLLLSLAGVSGTANGQSIPTSSTPRQLTVRVTRDGRLLPAEGTASSAETGIPGSGQTFSVLPDHPVKPGDSWTTDYERPNPVGTGSVKVHADSRYLRDEKVGGATAAVVESKGTEPMDLVIDFSTLGALLGGSGQGQQMPPQLAGVKLHETGTVTSDVTNWIDKGSRQVLKAKADSTLDLTMEFMGLPPAAQGVVPGQLTLKGPVTVTLEKTG